MKAIIQISSPGIYSINDKGEFDQVVIYKTNKELRDEWIKYNPGTQIPKCIEEY